MSVTVVLPTVQVVQVVTAEAATVADIEVVATEEAATEEAVTVADTEVVATEEAATEEAVTEEAVTEEAVTEEAVTVADTEVVVTEEAVTAKATTAAERMSEGQNRAAMKKYAVVVVTVGCAAKAQLGISAIFLPLTHSKIRSVTIEVSSWQVITKSVLKSTISMQSRRRKMTTEKAPFPAHYR